MTCAPYRARTKGKDERGVGYVKHNAIAGRSFAFFRHLGAQLARWKREVADVRVQGTTGEPPIVRFERDEAAVLRALNGRLWSRQVREVIHRRFATTALRQVSTFRERHLADVRVDP